MAEPHRIILRVDDDADERELVCSILAEIDPSLNVENAEDGLKAIEYLSKAKQEDALPCLVILDNNMPKLYGKQTLADNMKDDQLMGLTVIIFSTPNNSYG